MDHRWGGENLTRLAREAKIGPGTSTRLKNQDTSVGLNVLEKLATAFRVKPWQLLVPAFDAARLPHTSPMSAEAADAARILDAIEDDEKRVKAHAIFVQIVELGTAPAQP
jgi:transcriptional regulator with XRE-family HTH domain